ELEILVSGNPQRSAVVDRAAADDAVVVARWSAADSIGVAVRRPRFALRSDAVLDVGEHPPADRIALTGAESGVTDGPGVAPLDHGYTEPVAGLRIDAPLRDSPRDDAPCTSSAEHQHVVVVMSRRSLRRNGRGRSRRAQCDEVTLVPIRESL